MSTSRTAIRQAESRPSDARERLLETAYGLFCREGLRAVGIDRIVADAGVAKTSLYRHFRSKDDLVLAVLALREERWTRRWLEHEVHARGHTPQERLLAMFDVFDGWFRQPDYEACLFINSLVETHDRTHPIGAAAVRRMENVRLLIRDLAEEAGSQDPDGLSRQIQLVLQGAMIAATAGDVDAAVRARAVILPLLEREGLAPQPSTAR
jgi:AcrR family transcriptional regulator